MPEAWTGRLIGRMHNNRITYAELGAELGIGKAYVCQILNGVKKPKDIQKRIIDEYNFPQLERDEIMYTIADVLTDRLLPEVE